MCLLMLVSCSHSNKDSQQNDKTIITKATGIKITKHKGYTEVTIDDPWKADAILQTYILVPRDSALPDRLPKGALIRTPVRKALVYSSVHAGVIKELGHLNSVKGITDAQYFNMPEIKVGVKNGEIVDAGSSMSPTMEKVIALAPEVIILSPFQNAGYGTLASLGIPIIECADYMETTPLGRAEWIKLFGLLYNENARAASIYNDVVAQYNSLKELTANLKQRPKVISENVINGTWYVPGGDSYMAHFFADAGANYPWSDVKSAGSLSLDMPQVLNKAHDADIWLLKKLDSNLSYTSFKAQNELNAKFKAFKEKHIYSCDTEKTSLFQDFPFHPERLLKEYIILFHPGLIKDGKTKYFKPIIDE